MRELFDEAIGVAPPTRIDLDAVVVRQRRRLLLRPLGAAAAACVVTATVVVTGNALSRPARPVATLPVAGPSVAAPAPSRSAEPTGETLRRQSTALNELLRTHLHEVTVTDLRTRAATVEVVPSKDYPGYLAGNAHMAVVVLQSSAGTGDFDLYVRPGPGAGPSPSETVSEPRSCVEWLAIAENPQSGISDPQCIGSTGPGGETVLVTSTRTDRLKTFTVVVRRGDAFVSVSARNAWNGWKNDQAPTSFLPQPLLTLEQLKSIALDPRLAM